MSGARFGEPAAAGGAPWNGAPPDAARERGLRGSPIADLAAPDGTRARVLLAPARSGQQRRARNHAGDLEAPSFAVVGKRCAGQEPGGPDQRGGVLEPGRLHPGGMRARKHHEFDLAGIPGDVGFETAADQQTESVDGRVKGGLRSVLEWAARVLGGKHVDPLGAELDRVRDRRVIDHPTVDQPTPVHRHRRKNAGDRRRRSDGVTRWPMRKQQLASVVHIECHQVKRDRRILQPFELEVMPHKPPQRSVRHHMVSPPAHAAGKRAETDGKYVLSLEAEPNAGELGHRVDGLGTRADECGVERANRGANQGVRRDPALI